MCDKDRLFIFRIALEVLYIHSEYRILNSELI